MVETFWTPLLILNHLCAFNTPNCERRVSLQNIWPVKTLFPKAVSGQRTPLTTGFSDHLGPDY